MKQLLINKTNLFEKQITSAERPNVEEGDILFKIDKYAFTTNNITYAVAAPQLSYWSFFPAPEPWGIIPVWGYATVVESRHAEIKAGERCYGYFPMSEFLLVQPGKVNPVGFADLSAHRQELSPVYNYYSRVTHDPDFEQLTEDYQPIIKPLFVTSFLNYHFLKEENFFDADTMILTSASSKTGLALAYMLRQHKAEDGKQIIGLTSKRNLEFVQSTGYYDEVFTYDEVPEKIRKTSSVIIDFAGNADLLFSLYEHLEAELKHVSLIGLTDWTSGKTFKRIPVAKFFFAPNHAQKKYKEWGVPQTNQRIAKALSDFIADAKNWMELAPVANWEALADLYDNMLKGQVDPRKGYLVQIGD